MLLENEYLRAEFDGVRLTSLVCKGIGHELIDSPEPEGFFLNLAGGNPTDCKECLVKGSEQTLTVSRDGNVITAVAERLKIDNGRSDSGYADVKLTLRVELDGERLVYTSELENHSGMYVTDLEFPRVGKLSSLGDGKPTLFISQQPGKLIHNIGETLSNGWRHRENGSNTIKALYPGEAMLGFYALLDRTSSLFMTSLDPDFVACEQKLWGDPDDCGKMILSMCRFPCVADGTYKNAPIALTLYKGDWHRGADEYADFIKDYRPLCDRPDWAREMLGYFLVINRQQFGCEMWSYDTLPKLWELAKAHGFDTLGLFGWYHSGHDNMYPDLEVSETLGGAEKLKKGIKDVQKDGGRVTLYYQGHLIDPVSDFSHSELGEYVTAKNIWGNNYLDFYSKSHKSDFLAKFSRKSFNIACPATPEWRELMLEREKWLAEFDPDGYLYDQLGSYHPYICFDKRHDHGVCNGSSFSYGRRQLVESLQKGAKAIGKDKIFMSEHICDIYSASLDAVHGIGVMPGARGDRAFEIGGGSWKTTIFPDMFRYVCPDAVVTLRNPNPFIEARAANFAFVFGFVLEMELRYEADREDILADKFASKREWAFKVSALRKKYIRELTRGRYVADVGIENPDASLLVGGYETEEGRFAVALWNDSDEAKTPEISVAGRRLVSFETVDASSDKPLEMPENSVAVAIYE